MAKRTGPRRLSVTVQAPATVRAPGLGAWLAGLAPARVAGEVAIVFVGDRRMRALNREYRGIDAPTDVLSFPADASHEACDGVLGDIVIATGVARRQAHEAGHAFSAEARVLALHGLLHLLGYDHETDGGAMARLEARLRRRGGLRDGLIARARRPRR